MKFDAAIFDLDGTLLDTLTDLSTAANHALQSVGRPTYEREAYRTLVGQGVDQLFIDALGPNHQHLHAQAAATYNAYYAEHRFVTTAPYPGIDAMLDQLQANGIQLGILSNKPHDATGEVINRFFGQYNWSVIRGHKPNTPPKPDPTSAREVMAEMEVAPNQCIYLGDSKVDMLVGKAAGMFTVGVSWGFRSVEELQANGADAIIDEPGELLTLMGL